MNKHYYTLFISVSLLFQSCDSILGKSRRSGGHQDANSISFYVNQEKLHFICSELTDRIYKKITIVKNENEEIPFFSHFHKNGTFDLRSTEKLILTEKDSLFFNNSKIEIPVLTVEYTINSGSKFWGKDEINITCTKPNLPIQLSSKFIDSINNKIALAKHLELEKLPIIEDYKNIIDELFLASLTGDSNAKNHLYNLSKIYPMDKSDIDRWLRYKAIIKKREEIQS
ncbi:hypothetical protein [Sphingobacterium bovistauri]|uniref:DUF4369 domain-containing protein n=1 Tax=Sphingobacterium bovistauri TaxID=2781959 RepID=A0ABS7Z344_9SPHI|nr:hypothetical protein [Sphingobacterium bovistauri]MCA5004576.1 hypothetical protein [Sphingobacterium bovistauri]